MAEAKKPAADKAEPKLVRMIRSAEQYPDGPHEADVHPGEVENYRAGGFEVE